MPSNEENIDFSVVIPSKNRAEKLRAAVLSVLSQTHTSYEIIICDDGSTDQTSHVVKELSILRPNKIRYIAWDESKGSGFARNRGMLAARGRYISFLDSDDIWLPCKLITDLSVLSGDRNVVCISGAVRVVRHSEKDRLCFQIPKEVWQKDSFKKFVLGKISAPTPTITFDRMLLSQVGFMKTAMKRNQDVEFLLRLLSVAELRVVQEVTCVIYTELDNQYGHTRSLRNAFTFWMENKALIEKSFGSRVARRFEVGLHTSIINSALMDNDRRILWQHLNKRIICGGFPSISEFRSFLAGVYYGVLQRKDHKPKLGCK